VRVRGLRTDISFWVASVDLDRLRALAQDRNAPQKHVWRAQIVLLTAEGFEGLLRNKTRPSRIARRSPSWTDAAIAEAVSVSVSSMQRIWPAQGLRPHRIRQFKLSKDPEFVDKPRDVVGLYFDLPARAVVLSGDEKSQI
jgi:hypothetical protein